MQEYTERLGYAPLGRLLLRLSLPSIAAAVTLSLYNIVDTFWVAKLGHEAIAALTIVFPYQILYFAVGSGTGIGIGALVSRRFGENNVEATNHAAGQIFFLSVFWGLLFMMAAVLFSGSILPLIGATADIMEYSTQYMVTVAYGGPQMLFIIVASSLIRGSGDAVKPMVMMIAASVINIILDPLMIMGLGPFPEMGIRGAALATVIAQSCGAALGLYYLLARKTKQQSAQGRVAQSLGVFLLNRSRYSITHHAFIGMKLYSDAGRREEAHMKYLHLHEHEMYPEVYTEREQVVLDYVVKVVKDAHLVTDDEFNNLRRVLREYNMRDERLKKLSKDEMERHVSSQIVELTWLCGHFCLLNKWFTVLQVPDEGPDDEDNFLAVYEQLIPADIRKRNEDILQGGF